MQLPFFFEEKLPAENIFNLSEDASKHIIQVLRMRKGGQLKLVDGKGKVTTAEIVSEYKKATKVKILTTHYQPQPIKQITIAISLVKNSSRFEWFLEKATEIGISNIVPVICEHTEKQNFRFQRMKTILTNAMLQSQQAWLPALSEPIKFKEFVTKSFQPQKFIAHCFDEEKKQLDSKTINEAETLILIGPEGDFTKDEVDTALQNNFIPVSLGSTRLRTETAGIVACVLLNRAMI